MKTIWYILLGLSALTVIPAFGSNGQTSSDNSSDSDALTISLYSGIGDVNLGGLAGIGIEWMFRNASVNLGIGKGLDCTGTSTGIKVYDSDASSKNRIFGGVNYIRYYPNDYENIEILGGYRHTAGCGIYFSPYAGLRRPVYYELSVLAEDDEGATLKLIANNSVCCGLNVGYQFKSIHLK